MTVKNCTQAELNTRNVILMCCTIISLKKLHKLDCCIHTCSRGAAAALQCGCAFQNIINKILVMGEKRVMQPDPKLSQAIVGKHMWKCR